MAEAGSSSSGAPREPKSSDEVLQMFNQMRQEIEQLSGKINELDNETQEHDLVLKALEPMDPSRKSFRLIGACFRPLFTPIRPSIPLRLERATSLLSDHNEPCRNRASFCAQLCAACSWAVPRRSDGTRIIYCRWRARREDGRRGRSSGAEEQGAAPRGTSHVSPPPWTNSPSPPQTPVP